MVVLVLGGQYGDEGKGWVTQFFARSCKFDLVIRVGGSNAGHSCLKDGKEFEMRHLPCSWEACNTPIFIPETALIDPEVFLNEVSLVRDHGYTGDIWLSTEATLVEKGDLGWRRRTKEIGSTGSGVAPTRAKRLLREARKVYQDTDFLYMRRRGFSSHVSQLLPILSDPTKKILVEGTQGFGLSLNFSGRYPYTTSVDLTPYQVLAECGLPFGVHKVLSVLVFRTFPVRIPNPPKGSSGYMKQEITWEEVSSLCGHPVKVEYDCRPPIWEKNTPRRIGMFEEKMLKRAIWHCRPSVIFLTHFDWYFPDLAETGMTEEANRKVVEFEYILDHAIGFVGVGGGKFLFTEGTRVRYENFMEDLI